MRFIRISAMGPKGLIASHEASCVLYVCTSIQIPLMYMYEFWVMEHKIRVLNTSLQTWLRKHNGPGLPVTKILRYYCQLGSDKQNVCSVKTYRLGSHKNGLYSMRCKEIAIVQRYCY